MQYLVPLLLTSSTGCVTLRCTSIAQRPEKTMSQRTFTAQTDHNSLRWFRNFQEPEGQVAGWLEQLAEYQFYVVHRPGKQHDKRRCAILTDLTNL
ncbi:hypothetical protein T10_5058 [Trichinella papuae]|uniref:Retrovirus-related Pol polyprotein from transposon n=1 Tax=Trichinella papuae TaxID=268474 RepID=A0A0V1M439_9BILA|nr:hypothetical protein T10_5058 [Trichinella papuae]